MRLELEKEVEERLKAKFAATLFGELDSLLVMERDVEEKIERLAAELSAIRSQKVQVTKVIKDAGIRRTGSAGEEGSPAAQPADLTTDVEQLDDAKTHKQMIMEIITEVGEVGVRPVEIGNAIKDRYGKDITSGLHTQIARLSKEGKIRRQGEGWKLSQKNAG